MGISIAEMSPSVQQKPRYPDSAMERFAKWIVQARCTDNILFSAALAAGSAVLLLQTCPVFLPHWVLLTEPRPINKTNENGEQMESTFHYNEGYFQICRYHKMNESGVIYTETEIPPSESTYNCHLNPLFSREDLSEFSVASLAISMRLGMPALLHISGAFICCLAFVAGISGHIRRTAHTLLSAVCYICGSLVLSTAVLMFVCVVDDELAPRMKPNAAGEPSKFSYRYGIPFFSAALSFLPVQICACLQAFLYFRRYPSVVEKLKFVPGLEAKLRHAQLDKELGIPPVETFKRGSLASYLPLPSAGRASSCRSSVSSFNQSNLMFIQEV